MNCVLTTTQKRMLLSLLPTLTLALQVFQFQQMIKATGLLWFLYIIFLSRAKMVLYTIFPLIAAYSMIIVSFTNLFALLYDETMINCSLSPLLHFSNDIFICVMYQWFCCYYVKVVLPYFSKRHFTPYLSSYITLLPIVMDSK